MYYFNSPKGQYYCHVRHTQVGIVGITITFVLFHSFIHRCSGGKVGHTYIYIAYSLGMIVYNLASKSKSDMMRFFQAVSTNMYIHGCWRCQPEKTLTYCHLMI